MTERGGVPSGSLDLILIEDSDIDVELAVDALKESGLCVSVRRVEDESALRSAITERLPDGILSDWTLPNFSGQKALEIAHASCPDVPFVFVSGTISEASAIAALRQGANDYVFKHQLHELGPALTRALNEARVLLQLRISEATYHSLFDNMLNGVASCRLLFEGGVPVDFSFVSVNNAFETLTGLNDVVGRKASDVLPGLRESDVNLFEILSRVVSSGQAEQAELYVSALKMWLSISVYCPQPECFVTVFDVITERKLAERKIIRLNRVLAVLSSINALIVRVHKRDELFEESCRIALQIGQFKMAWIGLVDQVTMKIVPVTTVGAAPAFLEIVRESLSLTDDALMASIMPVRAVREKNIVVCNDLRTEPKNIYVQDRIDRGILSVVFLPLLVGQEVQGLFALYSDEAGFFDEEELQLLTELAGDIGFALDHINKEERLNYLAYYDELTGLPNRAMFLEQISQRLRPRNGNNTGLALALLDIDRFLIMNETLGRKAGDELLKLLVQRLQHSEIDFDTVACVGVNCFGVLLLDPSDAHSIAHTLEQLLSECFDKSFHLKDSEFRMAGKVGVALYPHDGSDAEMLYKNAETALKRARGAIEPLLFYSPEMNIRVAAAFDLESRLRTAVELKQFVLYYQPKVNLVTGKMTSVEALIRWNDPQSGLVPPVQFIPILEETGLIYEVGRWALNQALADNQHWRAAGLAHIRVAVNVSPLQMRHRNFIDEVKQAIGDDPQVAAGLELELTESLIMEDVNHSIDRLQEIRALGVTIAIDDFGTGFSSLSYLAKLPLDTLKIDRSFVIEMTAGPQGLALVSTIINLAHALKLKVVAEGVDTEEQARLLRLLSCDEMQGYLFSQPLPGKQLETMYLSPGSA